MRLATASALALASFALVTACGGGNDCCGPKPQPGTFSANVAGASSATLSGNAGFVLTSNILTIALSSSSGSSSIQLTRMGGLPASGSYQIDPNASPSSGAFVATYAGGGTNNFAGTSGTVTISSSAADRVRGSFNFTATGGTSGTATVTVSGTFDAPQLTAR
jgi:hypothetical protein